MTGPLTCHEASTGNLPDQMDRFSELSYRDLTARSIAALQARGEWNQDRARSLNPDKYPPLTVAEHLEMLALGERIARYYRHPSQVDKAVRAGPAGNRSQPLPALRPRPPGPLTASGPKGSTGSMRTPASAWTTPGTPRRLRRCAMSDAQGRAVSLAQHYFRLIAERAGMTWDGGNDTEIELMVCCIIDATTAGLQAQLAGVLAEVRVLDRLRPTCVICLDAAADRQTTRGPACTDCVGDLPDDDTGTDPDRPETWAFPGAAESGQDGEP